MKKVIALVAVVLCCSMSTLMAQPPGGGGGQQRSPEERIAAMKEHGLKVLCVSLPWQERHSLRFAAPVGIMEYNGYNINEILNCKIKLPVNSPIKKIAKQCRIIPKNYINFCFTPNIKFTFFTLAICIKCSIKSAFFIL